MIDVLGYHTGSLVAAEAARQRPDQVGRIVMISAPVLTDDELSQLHDVYAEIPLDIAGTRFRKLWDSVVAHKGPGATLEMLAMSFAENLRAGENYEWGHRAAFAYAPGFPAVVSTLPHPITVLMPGDDLAEVTPRIIPGVVAMQAGAWWQPDEQGIDKGGCANVLSSARITALAKGNSHQTMLVEVAKA